MKIYQVTDPEFAEYGKVVTGYDVQRRQGFAHGVGIGVHGNQGRLIQAVHSEGKGLFPLAVDPAVFQQAVLDTIDENTSCEQIKKSLIRYNSRNFDKKIQKNLDELLDLKLIEKMGDNYSKTNL